MKNSKAYTLIEMVIALSIAFVLLLLVVTNWQFYLVRTRTTTAINQLLAVLYIARNTAITTGLPTSVCPTSDGKTCSTDWGDGQLVFIDTLKNGKVRNNKAIVRIFDKLPKDSRMEFQAFPTSSYLTYAPTGFTLGQNGTFTFYPYADRSYSRSLVISKSGHLRIIDGAQK